MSCANTSTVALSSNARKCDHTLQFLPHDQIIFGDIIALLLAHTHFLTECVCTRARIILCSTVIFCNQGTRFIYLLRSGTSDISVLLRKETLYRKQNSAYKLPTSYQSRSTPGKGPRAHTLPPTTSYSETLR